MADAIEEIYVIMAERLAAMNLKAISEMRLCAKHKAGICIVLALTAYLLFDTLTALCLELLHASFEMIEFSFDVLIEHLFDTDRHTSQLISFYMMLSIAAFLLYRLVRRLPGWYGECQNKLIAFFNRTCQECKGHWHMAPMSQRIKWGAILTLGACLLIAGVFN